MKLFTIALGISFFALSCQSNPKTTEAATALPVQKLPDSVTVVQEHPQVSPMPPAAEQTAKKKTVTHTAEKTTAHGNAGSSSATAAQNNAGSVSSASNNTAQRKKGWSKTAKGAVIGGVTGAAAGAIIDKNNRGAGAVIGGAVGAGAGAIIGNQMDKKDGRH